MSKNEIIWNNKWKQLEHLGKGGQGLIYRAQNIESGDDNYVLKILKEQKNPNKRARMYKEVAAYKILSHPGIPKLIDTNAEAFEGTEPLFLITEYIAGPTLEMFITENGPMDLPSGYTFITNLLNIVGYSHGEDVLHRDIKPDNIILKNGNLEEVILIDFGLSFNIEYEERMTPSSEQLTNRFLHLPELNNQSAKTDLRTDVTYCAGILFYILTGEYPQDLIDHDNKLPHQRNFAQKIISQLSERQAKVLQRIFDRAFANHIDYRYQSIDAFKIDLEKLMNIMEEKEANPEANLKKFKEELQKRSKGEQVYLVRDLLSKTNIVLTRTMHFLSQEIGDPFETIQSGMSYDYEKYIYINNYGLRSTINHDKFIRPDFFATITGSEIIFTLKQNENEEILRSPISDIKWEEVSQFIRNYFLNRINELLE